MLRSVLRRAANVQTITWLYTAAALIALGLILRFVGLRTVQDIGIAAFDGGIFLTAASLGARALILKKAHAPVGAWRAGMLATLCWIGAAALFSLKHIGVIHPASVAFYGSSALLMALGILATFWRGFWPGGLRWSR